MKRLFSFVLILLALTCSASAQTITAMATEPYMERFALCACYARIHDYDSDTNMLEVELILPEIFSREDVEGLKAGDCIYTDGREVAVTSVTEAYGYIVLNMGDYEFSEGSVWLMEDGDGNYRPVIYEDYVWMELARIEVPVTDRLLFLDGINPSSGEPLEKPTVHSAGSFLSMLNEGPGFTANNVIAVFDENGDLAVIQRYYVPWQ